MSAIVKDPRPLPGVEAALRRASQRAREIALQTHTPIVLFRDGRVEKQMVNPAIVETSSESQGS